MSENFEQTENSWIRKKILVFIVCIIISTLFWFLVVLSKDYNDVISIPVRYVNVPNGKVIINELPRQVSVELRSFGFNLLKFRIFNPEEELLIDVSQQIRMKNSNLGYVATNSRLYRFSSQMNTNIQLIRIHPDTLFFIFDDKRMKKIKVIPDIDLSFTDQHDLSGEIRVTPSEVKLTGPSRYMDSVQFLRTEKIALSNLEKPVRQKIQVKIPPTLNGMVSEPSTVEVLIPVDKFTEGSVSVPVTVENAPAGYHVKTYPEQVKIIYLVALSNYEKIKPEQFNLVADLKSATGSSTRIKVQVKNASPFVRNIRIQPEKVEFILVRE